MFALVLYTVDKTTDIVKKEDIKYPRGGKGDVNVLYGHKYYKAKIVKESDHREWLEKLSVSQDGRASLYPESVRKTGKGITAKAQDRADMSDKKVAAKKIDIEVLEKSKASKKQNSGATKTKKTAEVVGVTKKTDELVETKKKTPSIPTKVGAKKKEDIDKPRNAAGPKNKIENEKDEGVDENGSQFIDEIIDEDVDDNSDKVVDEYNDENDEYSEDDVQIEVKNQNKMVELKRQQSKASELKRKQSEATELNKKSEAASKMQLKGKRGRPKVARVENVRTDIRTKVGAKKKEDMDKSKDSERRKNWKRKVVNFASNEQKEKVETDIGKEMEAELQNEGDEILDETSGAEENDKLDDGSEIEVQEREREKALQTAKKERKEREKKRCEEDESDECDVDELKWKQSEATELNKMSEAASKMQLEGKRGQPKVVRVEKVSVDIPTKVGTKREDMDKPKDSEIRKNWKRIEVNLANNEQTEKVENDTDEEMEAELQNEEDEILDETSEADENDKFDDGSEIEVQEREREKALQTAKKERKEREKKRCEDDESNKSNVDESDEDDGNGGDNGGSIKRKVQIDDDEQSRPSKKRRHQAWLDLMAENLPPISADTVKYFKFVASMLQTEYEEQAKTNASMNHDIAGPSTAPNVIGMSGIGGDSKIEIQRNSGIFLEKAEVENVLYFNDNPRNMIRRLMRLIVGDAELRKMSAGGRSQRPGIPSEIKKVVFKFVKKNKAEGVAGLSYREYTRTLNLMCSTLRSQAKTTAAATTKPADASGLHRATTPPP